MAVPAFVINLERDVSRLSRFRDAVASVSSLDFRYVAGVLGSHLPRSVRLMVTDNEQWADQKGEIGCFISHVKVWELIAAETVPFCVVLEDDADLVNIERIHQIAFPDDAELIFLNDQMSLQKAAGDPSRIPECISVSRVLSRFDDGGALRQRNVGTYGYALTPDGARKLLSAVSRDLCYGHVDWRLLRYALSEGEIIASFSGTELEVVLRRHHNPGRPPSWALLRAYSLDAPLVRHGEYGSSRGQDSEPETVG